MLTGRRRRRGSGSSSMWGRCVGLTAGWRATIAALVARVGYGPPDPVLVAVQSSRRPPVFVTQGRPLDGTRLTATTRVYTASLSKQLTAACAGSLLRSGRLDIETPLAQWLPEL